MSGSRFCRRWQTPTGGHFGPCLTSRVSSERIPARASTTLLTLLHPRYLCSTVPWTTPQLATVLERYRPGRERWTGPQVRLQPSGMPSDALPRSG